MARKRARKPVRNSPEITPDERDRAVPPIDYREQGDGSVDVTMPDDDEVDPEGQIVEEQEDGSAIVSDAAEDKASDEDNFDENLCDTIDDAVLSRLATNLLEDIKRDQEARAKRDEQYAEGIKRTGLGNEAPGGADFSGASKAVHPALVEGCIDFAARAMKEIFPAEGPVKTHIIGKQTKEKLQKADRKRKYMNWQLTTQIKEYPSELETMLSQLPLGGGQYLKLWYDERLERTRCEFVPIDYLLRPFAATELMTAERITHKQILTRVQFEERVESGMYCEVPMIGDGAITPDQSAAKEATDKVQGNDDMAYNEDGLRTVYEVLTNLTLKDGDKRLDKQAQRDSMPYVVTIDEISQKVCALRRNWDPKDNNKAEPLQWVVEFPFVPWRGGPIGLAHIIGSMAGAATGALRALLDSALINNMPGGIKLKGARMAGQSISVEPTQLSEIDAGPGVDDIRKLAMPYPFNPPSTVLFTLLEWLTQQAKGVVATAEERIGDANANMPVGTALALIEQGSITFSAIHSRLHKAQKQVLAILHRLNARHLNNEEVVEDLDELVVSREDFQGPMDVEPVSDPNIFSDAQRYAQMQAAMQLSMMPNAMGLYDPAELHQWALTLLKVPVIDKIFKGPEEPQNIDAITENYLAATQPRATLKAFDNQRHIAHLKVHLSFMSSPMYASNPVMAGSLPKLVDHCREHIAMMYMENAMAAAQAMQQVSGEPKPEAEADSVSIADKEMAKELGPLMPLLQQAMQTAQAMVPKPPTDPSVEVAQINAKAQSDRTQVEAQLKQMTEKMDAQAKMQEMQLDAQKMQLEKLAHDDEMRIASRNAELAAISENMNRQSQMQLAQMKEYFAQQKGQSDGAISTVLAEMQRQREQENIVLTGLIQAMMVQKQTTDAEGKKSTEMSTQATQMFSATQNEMRTAIAAMMESIAQLARNNPKPKGWKLLMNDNGDIGRIEPDFGDGDGQ